MSLRSTRDVAEAVDRETARAVARLTIRHGSASVESVAAELGASIETSSVLVARLVRAGAVEEGDDGAVRGSAACLGGGLP